MNLYYRVVLCCIGHDCEQSTLRAALRRLDDDDFGKRLTRMMSIAYSPLPI